MTTCIRFTMFPPDLTPVTVVASEHSFKDSVGDTQLPSEGPMFIIKDTFPVDGDPDDLARQTAIGMMRAEERFEDEANMALFYHWTIAHSFPKAKAGGIIAMTIPSPLSAEQLTYVHEALAKHPDYRDYHFLSLDADGQPVHYPIDRLES